MLRQNLLLPDSVLLDVLLCLSARDIGQCLATSQHLQRLVTESSQLQLQIFLRQGGMFLNPAPGRSARMMLDDVLRSEESLRHIRFGSSASRRSSLSLKEWQGPIPELVANAGDKIYMAGGWNIPHTQVARHVLVYDLSKQEEEPEKVELERPFRFWAVDAAEGIMVLGWAEPSQDLPQPSYKHCLTVLSLSDMKPLNPKVEKIPLAILPMIDWRHQISIRGELVVVTRWASGHGEITGEVQVFNCKTGLKVFRELCLGTDRILTADIISSHALLIAYSHDHHHSFIRLYSIDSKPIHIRHVATYHLPVLKIHVDTSSAMLNSSPVSLDGAMKDTPGTTILEDGEGIVTLWMDITGRFSDSLGNAGSPWRGNTEACMLTRPFHDEAVMALREARSTPKEHLWTEWGPDATYWNQLPRMKGRQALCGYRQISVAQAPFRPGRPLGVAAEVEILDFNAASVKKEASDWGDSTASSRQPGDAVVTLRHTSVPMLIHPYIFAHDPTGRLKCLRSVKRYQSVPHGEYFGPHGQYSGHLDHKRLILQGEQWDKAQDLPHWSIHCFGADWREPVASSTEGDEIVASNG